MNKIKYELHFYMANFGLLIITYICYLSSAVIVGQILFNRNKGKELQNEFNFLIAFQELISFSFIRSKTSLKYYPRIVMLLSLIFLIYYQQTNYEIYKITFNLLMIIYFLLTIAFLLLIEIPIVELNYSNLNTNNNLPNQNRPRALYFPF
jgi:hypothetical protein